MNKILVLGIGNTIRGDDAVGIIAVRALKEELGATAFDIKETQEAGLSLLDVISGYEKAIIVDSIHTGKKKPGSIYKFTNKDLKPAKDPYSSHHVGLGTILEMADKYNVRVPAEITIYAIEIEEADSFKEGLTTRIKKASLKIIDMIKKDMLS